MSLVIFRNGKLFDGLWAETLDGLEVLVENDRIKEVSDKPISATTARVVDLGGRTLMPGLIDAHFHAVAADPNIGRVEDMPASLIAQYSRGFLEASVGRGFTTIRDAGGADYGLARAIETGLIAGPRLFYSGRALSQTGGHGDFRSYEQGHGLCSCGLGARVFSRIVDGVPEVRRAARDELRKGASQIKIMASGGVASPSDPTWVCQGRRETRPKGGAKHCHRGLRGEMVRGGRDEAGGGVSRKRREGVARAQFPAGGDAERSGCSVLFSRAAVVEAEALAVHFQDMDVMGQSVEQRPGQALGTERLGPFVEGKIRGDQNRGALVALRDELEQQLRSGLRQRDEAQLVNDQQLVVGELLLQPQQPSFIARLHELMHERRGGDEAHRQPPLARGQSQSLGHVSLPGAARSQSDDVLAPLDPFTSGELEHLDLAE